jgi:hypothetical protein
MTDQPTTRNQVLRIILDWAHPGGDGDKAADLIDAIYRERIAALERENVGLRTEMAAREQGSADGPEAA